MKLRMGQHGVFVYAHKATRFRVALFRVALFQYASKQTMLHKTAANCVNELGVGTQLLVYVILLCSNSQLICTIIRSFVSYCLHTGTFETTPI